MQHVVGGSANNLIVAMKDGIVIFDAPVDERAVALGHRRGQGQVSGQAGEATGAHSSPHGPQRRHPGLCGGRRRDRDPGPGTAFCRKDDPGRTQALARRAGEEPKQAKIVDVKDTMSLKDDTVEINLYNIPNPHADGMIIGHVVGPNLVWVTDLISPRGPIARSPNTVAVGDALRKTGITEATIVGGHGTTAKQAEIAPALAAN